MPARTITVAARLGLCHLFVLASCDREPTRPDTGFTVPPADAGVPVRVEVTPAADTLTALGDVTGFQAVVIGRNDELLSTAPVVWSVSDAAVAEIERNAGVATALAEGTTTVVGRAGTAFGSATLVVRQEPAALDVSPGQASLAAGETLTLAAALRDRNGHPVAGRRIDWASSDPGVVEVDVEGKVTAVSPGVAVVTARHATLTATARITVTG